MTLCLKWKIHVICIYAFNLYIGLLNCGNFHRRLCAKVALLLDVLWHPNFFFLVEVIVCDSSDPCLIFPTFFVKEVLHLTS